MSLVRVACASACIFSVVSVADVVSAQALDDRQDYEVSARKRASGGIKSGCMPAALLEALARVRAACGQAEVISGHRPGARIAGSGRRSYHASCRAVDFNAPRACALEALAGWSGGLGVYSGSMRHIHLDTGPRVRFARGGGGAGGTRMARSRSSRRYAGRATRSSRHASRATRKYRTASRSRSGRRYAASAVRLLRKVRHVYAHARYGKVQAKRGSRRARSGRRR